MRPVLRGLLDGNIVRPYGLSELFFRLHKVGLCQIACSVTTLDELHHSWLAKTSDERKLQVSNTIERRLAGLAEIEALLSSYHAPQLSGIDESHTSDKADWYLIAIAREAQLGVIVSQDRGFRGKQIKKDFGISVMTADEFLLKIYKHHSALVKEVVADLFAEIRYDPRRPLFAEALRFEARIRRALRMRSL